MSEICDSCSASYDYIYWVPDHVWEKIRPLDSGHGGLLCLRCVHRRSNEAGFVLRFSGSDNWWITDELTAAKADNQCWEMAVAELNRTISKQQAENERLRGRVSELEEALRPFAAEAEFVPDDAIDIHLNYMMDGAEVLERAGFTAQSIHRAAQRLRQQADELEKA